MLPASIAHVGDSFPTPMERLLAQTVEECVNLVSFKPERRKQWILIHRKKLQRPGQ